MNDSFDDLAARLGRAAGSNPAPDLDPELVASAPDRRAPRLVRHGRAARATAVALTAGSALAVGALVVPSLVAPREPLFTASASTPSGEASAMSADSRIALWVDYEYLVGDGLSTASERGTVYELRRTGDAASTLRDAAEALGLTGEPSLASYSDPSMPSWVIGPEDGSAASLTLSWVGTGSWWYSDPGAYPEPVCTEVEYEVDGEKGPTTERFEECTTPEVPAAESQAPSETEAQRLAAELFAATGTSVAPDEVRVTADAWQTVATANLVVDGVTTAVESSVAWSPLGEIAWATGHAIEVVDRGAYDTVSAASAVERLEDWRWFGAAGPDYASGAIAFAAESGLARDAIAAETDPDAPADSGTEPSDPGAEPAPGETPSEEPVEPAPVDPVDPVDPGETPSEEPSEEPAPVDPMPEPTPETVTITLERAEATLLLMWDAEGGAWLVPGYAYENPEHGFWNTVASLIEGVIALPEPIEVEPLPAVIEE